MKNERAGNQKVKSQIITVQLRQPKSRKQLQAERRWRIAENILNMLLGLGSIASAFYCGWLVGSGAIR